MTCTLAQAKPKFNASEITNRSPELMICDLDGDGLKDLVLMDDLNLSIFYQDAKRGFTREPQQSHRLEHRPCVIWTAKLGGPAASVLVMTSDGVSELSFTNRTGPPSIRQIIKQTTIVPRAVEDTNAMNAMRFPLSVETGGGWPLLLVPAADGLEVWQHRHEWQQAQVITNVIDDHLSPSLANPGYTKSLGLNLSVGDVNGDGRDDLMVRRSQPGSTNIYNLYPQQTDGLFPLEPTFTYVDKVEPNSWHGWVDLNRDGNVDLIKGVWLNEPSFLPGLSAGKVLVRTYVADAHGRIPSEPRQVFRKNDWMAALPLVDVDGDGYPDLIMGYSLLDTREGARKQVTARKLDLNLRFHFNRAGAGFPQEPDCQSDVVIHVNEMTLVLGLDRRQYFERCIKFDGDFNGDGKKDLLVRDRSDGISAYFFVSREKGFSQEPDVRFNCPEQIDGWEVADLNNDGVSDLIVKLGNQNGFRVFISER